ncbi:superoxide dismutase [Bacillus spongiae]|uniref:superoxide dismutase n=1 Tax=Bacillus spongiae TaxID=2683610 RepID=A0ABU8HCP9_9BACI
MFKEFVVQIRNWRVELQNWMVTHEQNWLDADIAILDKSLKQCEHRTPNKDDITNLQAVATLINQKIMSFVSNREHSGENKRKPYIVPIGGHTLPPLPYEYSALEPYISTEIMRLHHDIHHLSYVNGLNNAEKELEKSRKVGDFSLIKHWERELAFHGSGHYLHSIFWEVMSPYGGGTPGDPLLSAINESFKNYAAFKQQFSPAANAVEGVGWALLVWSPRTRRLEILQSERHMLLTQWDTIPLLVLDVWEHAYYLQYKNVRKDYVENWWNLVNWKEVEKRYKMAKELTWQPY